MKRALKWIGQRFSWRRRRDVEAAMHDEMEFHREARIEDLIRKRGMDRATATRTARLEFGSVEAYREECRGALGFRLWDELASDLRFAVRGMRKSPGFSAAAIAILALAIAANGSFFSLYASYVLKPLPIRGVDRHFTLEGFDANGKSTYAWRAHEIEAFRQAAAVEGLYTADLFQVLVLAPSQRQSLIASVSGNYFSLLGTMLPTRGRVLAESDVREPVVVLSANGAARYFPNIPDPVGQQLRVRTTILTVIGVMPPEFTGTEPAIPDFWTGVGMQNVLRGRAPSAENRQHVAGLLAPGITVARAQAILSGTAARFQRPPGEEPIARVEVRLQPSFMPDVLQLNAAAALIFAAFWMVLLIACANLANLYLARAAARTHEIAMRISLGASRWRIVRQLLTESTFTALLGAAAGCALAVVTVQRAHQYAVSQSGVGGISMVPIHADWRILLYSAALGIAAGIAFGLLPAIEITSPSLTQSAKRGHSAFGGRIRPRRMRDILIGGQVAISLVLLILAGVLIRNIQRLDAVDVGYNLDRVFDLRTDQADAATLTAIARHPGVASLTVVTQVPLHGRGGRQDVTVEEQRKFRMVANRVDSRYFETLGLSPLEGRIFTAGEAEKRSNVAVISKATARALWPDSMAAVGRTLRLEDGVYQVIGVIPDVVSGWLFEGKDASAIYLAGAAGQEGMNNVMARVVGDAVETSAAIRQICAGVPNATGCEPGSMREVSSMQRFPFQVAAGVAGILGGLALLLTGIGLYSVASYTVLQRRREIGVHVALGASPARVMRRILSEAWLCVVFGVAAGLPVCLILSKLASSSMLQIQTFDPAAYLSVPLLLAVIATVACGVPARRAARLDPMLSLRQE